MARHFRRPAGTALAVATLVLAVIPAAAASAATRTWVSGVGDDINPCSRTLPCKTFAGAISRTEAGGEISVLDPGGYGAVTVVKAITIDGTGTLGSILHSFTTGVIVNAGPDDDVVLRGISLNGSGLGGVTCPIATGQYGIRLLRARSLRLEDVQISRSTTMGLQLAPSTDATVMLNRVDVGDVCGTGIDAAPQAGRRLNLTIRDSTITRTGTAVHAGAGAHVWLGGATIFANGTGLLADGGGIIDSWWGTNQIHGNGIDGTPTNVLGAPPEPPTPPAPAPAPAPAPPVTTTPRVEPDPKPRITVKCTVPKLTGLTLTAAKTALRRAHCAPGRVTRRRVTARKSVGRVLTQQPKAGTKLVEGAKVNVTVGRR